VGGLGLLSPGFVPLRNLLSHFPPSLKGAGRAGKRCEKEGSSLAQKQNNKVRGVRPRKKKKEKKKKKKKKEKEREEKRTGKRATRKKEKKKIFFFFFLLFLIQIMCCCHLIFF